MPTAEGGPQTLYDKVFQDHIVDERLDGTILLYIGTHTLVLHCAHAYSIQTGTWFMKLLHR
jgi:hypothetical protein